MWKNGQAPLKAVKPVVIMVMMYGLGFREYTSQTVESFRRFGRRSCHLQDHCLKGDSSSGSGHVRSCVIGRNREAGCCDHGVQERDNENHF
jgi:hypothetical protein